MNWNDIFDYDPDTGVLVWKVSSGKRISAGKSTSDTRLDRGYYRFQFRKERFFVHNVVWEMFNGKIPPNMVVDHIDHDRSNNRRCNLRLVTPGDNNRNRSPHNIGTSRCLGVTWHKKTGKWRSRISDNGRQVSLGLFDDIFDAYCARKSAEYRLGFHENHGKE